MFTLLLFLAGIGGAATFGLPTPPKTIQEVLQENAVEAYYTSKDAVQASPGSNHTFEFALIKTDTGATEEVFTISIFIKKSLVGVNLLDTNFKWTDYIIATKNGTDITSTWNNFTTYLLPSAIKKSAAGTEESTIDFFLSNPGAFGSNVTVQDAGDSIHIMYDNSRDEGNGTTSIMSIGLTYQKPSADQAFPAIQNYVRVISINSDSGLVEHRLEFSGYHYNINYTYGLLELTDVPSMLKIHKSFKYAGLEAGKKFSYDIRDAQGKVPAQFQYFQKLNATMSSTIDLTIPKTPGNETLAFDNAEEYFDLTVDGKPINITSTFGYNFSFLVMPVNLETDSGIVNFFKFYNGTFNTTLGGKIAWDIMSDPEKKEFSTLHFVFKESVNATREQHITVLYMADIGVAATIGLSEYDQGQVINELYITLNTTRTTYDISNYDFTGILFHDDPDAGGGLTGILPTPVSYWFILPFALIPLIRKKTIKI